MGVHCRRGHGVAQKEVNGRRGSALQILLGMPEGPNLSLVRLAEGNEYGMSSAKRVPSFDEVLQTEMLLRVVVKETEAEIALVTRYKTSKFKKYEGGS